MVFDGNDGDDGGDVTHDDDVIHDGDDGQIHGHDDDDGGDGEHLRLSCLPLFLFLHHGRDLTCKPSFWWRRPLF